MSRLQSRLLAGLVAVTTVATLPLLASTAHAVSASAPVIINEVYGGGGNAGASIRNDFIELYNASSSPVDLSTWSVQYASSAGTRWSRTNLTGTLPVGKTYVVSEAAGTNTALPEVVGDVTGTIPMSATTGKVALVNNQTTLPTACLGSSSGASACSARSDVIDFVGFGGANDWTGTGPTPVLTNATSASRSATHTNTLNNSADFSVGSPSPDACGTDCTNAPPPPPTEKTIAEIQGTGSASPLVGQQVTTRGVVTGSYPIGGFTGFYLQTAGSGGATDATPGASDGIFVYQPTGTVPATGAYVKVTGAVSEFNDLTEITVTPANVVALNEAFAPVTAVQGPWPATAAEREALEGMLFRPTGAFTVSNTFTTNQFGEVGLASGTTPLIQRTEKEAPGPAANSAIEEDNFARGVVLDDGSSTNFLATSGGQLVNGNLTPPYVSNANPVRVGEPVTFTNDVIVDYRFSLWRFQPTSQVVGPDNTTSPVTFTNNRTAAPDAARIGAADIKVASFNVLNYFTTLGDSNPSCTPFVDRTGNGSTVNTGCDQRGAWDAQDLARQQIKIVKAINALGADVVGLMEIENSARLGEPADEALNTLVAALNADAGSTVWAANPSSAELPPAASQDVITNAIIYKPAKVSRLGDARALGTQSGTGEAFDNAREPIGQAFTPVSGGSPLFFVVNHLKSKGSAGPWPGDVDDGDGQGASTESRVRQATALRDWVPTALPAGVKGVALAGDFNSYTMEDPLQVLYQAGYVDAETAAGGKEYSYSFSGVSGSLDHILLNNSLLSRRTGTDIWDINAEESIALEYSRYNYSATDFNVADPYRSSDHDPVIVGLTAQSATVPVQILATNDFHGRIQASGADAGAATMAGAVKQLRAAQPNTVFAAAGDLVGASTFESYIAKDKPTIDALNSAGLEVSSVGNHEFDQGYDDLVNRIMAPYDPTTNPLGGATWEYLGANVRQKATHDPALPETWVKDFGGIRVGFVGAVTEHLPELVSPAGLSSVEIENIVAATNRSAAALKANGADLVVLLVHEGAETTAYASATDPNTDFGKIVNGVSPDVDAIVSGHTHLAYNHAVPVQAWIDQGRTVTTRPVVSAGQYGDNLNQLVFQFDPDTEKVVGLTQTVLPLVTTPPYPVDAPTKAIVDQAVADSAVLGAQPLGTLTGPFNRAKLANGTTENRGGESTLGNLVAEVQRDQTGAQIALMNPGGLRADMVGNDPANDPTQVTYRQAANVQPFANTLVQMTLTGAQLRTALEQQWQPAGAARPFLRLGLSTGFTYTYDPAAATGSHITQLWLNGTPIDPAGSYAVTVNSFLAAGGDNFTILASGTNKRDTGKIDLQSMVDFLAQKGTASPDFHQRSVGVHLPAGAPATYTPGGTVAFDLSSLAFSTTPDQKDPSVTVSIDGTSLGTFAVDNTIGTDIFDEYGKASVSVVLPAGTTAGAHNLVVTGTTTGTTALVPITVSSVASTLALTSSASPSIVGAPVTFTATVAGATSGGTVQFTVDGTNLGAPVALAAGKATSPATSTLTAGGHTVVATYSGTAGVTGSTATISQVVQYKVKFLSPVSGSTNLSFVPIPVLFQLTNAAGVAIPVAEAQALAWQGCKVRVELTGATTVGSQCPVLLFGSYFLGIITPGWVTGNATIKVSITLPNAPIQVENLPIKLKTWF